VVTDALQPVVGGPHARERDQDPRDARRRMWLTAIMGVLILIPSMYGFTGKFIEFVHIYRGEPGGEFAVAPILNYLLASAGFFCMLMWAAWNGMFRDVEKPKFDFLDNEDALDREALLEAAARDPSLTREDRR
jgi:hypothetical protein